MINKSYSMILLFLSSLAFGMIEEVQNEIIKMNELKEYLKIEGLEKYIKTEELEKYVKEKESILNEELNYNYLVRVEPSENIFQLINEDNKRHWFHYECFFDIQIALQKTFIHALKDSGCDLEKLYTNFTSLYQVTSETEEEKKRGAKKGDNYNKETLLLFYGITKLLEEQLKNRENTFTQIVKPEPLSLFLIKKFKEDLKRNKTIHSKLSENTINFLQERVIPQKIKKLQK